MLMGISIYILLGATVILRSWELGEDYEYFTWIIRQKFLLAVPKDSGSGLRISSTSSFTPLLALKKKEKEKAY